MCPLHRAAGGSYAPELNPVEYLWAHLKEHQIANLLVDHGWELSLHATAAQPHRSRLGYG
jgi:hypothetical protein